MALLPATALISWRTRRLPLVALATLVWLLFLPLTSGESPHGGLINRAADLATGLRITAFAWTERDHRS
ncbi:MAG: hypothetical protein P8Z68_12965 [Kineosporiaceae bacterium]